jgi:hypothetical protein
LKGLLLMTAKQMAGIIVVIGVGLLAISLLANVIGIGDDPGFGRQQTMGSVAGAAIALVGVVLMTKKA